MTNRKRPVLLCIGDIDMDIIITVPAPPGKDQKIDGKCVARTAGGMAANVAVGASRLGTVTRLLGVVGDDEMGREALSALNYEGIDLTHSQVRVGVPTFFCVVLVDAEGEKSLVKAVSPAYLPQVSDVKAASFDGVTHVHMTFTKPDLAFAVIAQANAAGASISLDLEAADVPDDCGDVTKLIESVDLLFISENSRKAVEQRIGCQLASACRSIVMTRGPYGASVEQHGEIYEVSGHTIDVVDTTGAGDAFAAAYLHYILSGSNAVKALQAANIAGALSTQAYGGQAGMVSKTQIEEFLLAQKNEIDNA
ncbi:carbohydrate kinase family protein [Pacificibacter sp. AS14]|uniref:carbohydrate kinase family protein n=1 Tax=Pacificibacter sp. AS14 TaxID=3135785 RepID=UPI003173B652